MGKELTKQQIQQVRDLHYQGWSVPKIRDETGISKSTVEAIVDGTHRIPRRATMMEASRCPECGAKVQMPCRACGMRGGAK